VHRVAGGVGEDRVTKLDGMPVTGLHPTPAAEECFGGWIEVVGRFEMGPPVIR
jgi:hypothetical protein